MGRLTNRRAVIVQRYLEKYLEKYSKTFVPIHHSIIFLFLFPLCILLYYYDQSKRHFLLAFKHFPLQVVSASFICGNEIFCLIQKNRATIKRYTIVQLIITGSKIISQIITYNQKCFFEINRSKSLIAIKKKKTCIESCKLSSFEN